MSEYYFGVDGVVHDTVKTRTWYNVFEDEVLEPLGSKIDYVSKNDIDVFSVTRNIDLFPTIAFDDYAEILAKNIDNDWIDIVKLTNLFYNHICSNYSRFIDALIKYRGNGEIVPSAYSIYKWRSITRAAYRAMECYGLIKDVSSLRVNYYDHHNDRPYIGSSYGFDIILWNVFKERPSTSEYYKRNILRVISMGILQSMRVPDRYGNLTMTLGRFLTSLEELKIIMNPVDLDMVDFIKDVTSHIKPTENILFQLTPITLKCKLEDAYNGCLFDRKSEKPMGILTYLTLAILLLLVPFVKLYDLYRSNKFGWKNRFQIGASRSLVFGQSVKFSGIPENLCRPLLESIAVTILPIQNDLVSRKVKYLRTQSKLLNDALTGSKIWSLHSLLHPKAIIDIVEDFDTDNADAKQALMSVLYTLDAFSDDSSKVNGLCIILGYMYVAHVEFKDVLAGARNSSMEQDICTWLTT